MPNPLPNNLPRRPLPDFIGRDDEMDKIFGLLAVQERSSAIMIEGIGGIGKSALALEIAWRIARRDPDVPQNVGFSVVIYTTAQVKEVKGYTTHTLSNVSTTFDAICYAIAEALDYPAILAASPQKRLEEAKRVLTNRSALLIVDNLDEVTDVDVYTFLSELPTGCKALATTRVDVDYVQARRLHTSSSGSTTLRGDPIRLEPLPIERMKDIIRERCKDLELSLDPLHVESLVDLAKGVPLAAIVPLHYAKVHTIDAAFRVFHERHHPHNEVPGYIFDTLITNLQNATATLEKDAYLALLALTFFDSDKGATSQAVADTIRRDEKDEKAAQAALEMLFQLGLVHRTDPKPPEADYRYSLRPYTRDCLIKRVLVHETQWEKDARERWLAYYQRFAKKYGGLDWHHWAPRYGRLDLEWRNLIQVFEWCRHTAHDKDLLQFWTDDYVRQFANIWGLWDDRSRWLRHLISALRRSAAGSMPSAAFMDYSAALAFTLIHRGSTYDLREARTILYRAWQIGKDPNFQTHRNQAGTLAKLDVVITYVLLFLQMKKYHLAQHWLKVYKDTLQNSALSPTDFDRHDIEIDYYQGRIHFDQHDYVSAQPHFENMSTRGWNAHYDRAFIFALNYIADIAREQGDDALKRAAQTTDPEEARRLRASAKADFDTASRCLRDGARKSSEECKKDERRYAYYKRSNAYLECSCGRSAMAEAPAKEAIDLFDKLGMHLEHEDRTTLERIARGECPARDARGA